MLKLFTCMTNVIHDMVIMIEFGKGCKALAKPFISELAIQQEPLKCEVLGRLADASCHKQICAYCTVPVRVWGTFDAYTCQVVHAVATITHGAGGI